LMVRNWDKFQHYKKRNPPWVKLHFDMLASRDWVVLDDKSRVLAIACMLVASRNGGKVPKDPAYLQRVAYLHGEPDFTPLIECGFLAPCKQMLADARPETEAEAETETEGEPPHPPPIGPPPSPPTDAASPPDSTGDVNLAHELVKYWIDLQPERPPTPVIKKQHAKAKRLVDHYTVDDLRAGLVGIARLFPHSDGEPWDLFDLERKMAKAVAAARNGPKLTKSERRLRDTLEVIDSAPLGASDE